MRIRLRDMGKEGRKEGKNEGRRGEEEREQRASRRVRCGGRFCGGEGDGGDGDGELVAVVAVGSTREAMAGIAHVFRFVGFSSHRYTLPNSVTRPAPSFLADESVYQCATHRSPLWIFGIQHQLWPHFLVKLLRCQMPECHRRCLQCRSLLVCFLGARRDVWDFPVSNAECNMDKTLAVVAEVAVEDGGQHQTLIQQMVDALLVRLDSDHTVLGERTRC